ncbi:MAG: hypothetical protein ACI81T_002333, partial [Bacteroidia bacterium]
VSLTSQKPVKPSIPELAVHISCFGFIAEFLSLIILQNTKLLIAFQQLSD